MANKGLALMGTGIATGENRAVKAATEAISSPLLEDITIDGATGIIVNITGNNTLSMHEANEAMTLVMEAADEDAEIIFGTVIDEELGDEIKVTVIATGLGGATEFVSSAAVMNERITVNPHAENTIQAQATRESSEDFNHSVNADTSRLDNFLESDSRSEVTDHELRSNEEQLEQRAQAPTRSSLSQSLREAANNYDGNTNAQESPKASREEEAAPQRKETSSPKAKTIAEKLGFMNFDEDEFDTPSFLRKDDARSENNTRN